MEEAGTKRFQGKVQRLAGDVEAVGSDEALYRSLAEALGYSANRQPFRALAEAIPFSLLASLSVYDAEQLLLSAAGLASADGLLTAYIEGPVLKPGELRTFRVRPGNSPTTRLRGLARLVTTHRRGLASAMEDVEPINLWQLFVVDAGQVLVGKGRADDIALNVALPYLASHRGIDGASALRTLRAPADNRWVNALRKRLESAGLIIKPYRALQQQGLLELSLRFCRYDHCEACPSHAELSRDGPEP